MKLRNKLILSCAALAAVATTAVSTTFAWYTQNTDVTASGLTASTQSLDDATLLISLDNYNWGSSVDLSSIFNSQYLKPVQYAKATEAAGVTADNFANGTYYTAEDYYTRQSNYLANTTYYTQTGTSEAYTYEEQTAIDTYDEFNDAGTLYVKKTKYVLATAFVAGTKYYTLDQTSTYARDAAINLWDAENNRIGNVAEAGTDYLQFTLFFKSAGDSINVKNTIFSLNNSTTDFDPKLKLSSTGNPGDTTYIIDLLRALVVNVSTAKGHDAVEADNIILDNWEQGYAAGEFTTLTHKAAYSADALADQNGKDSVTEGNKANWNAHSYYNAVKLLNRYKKATEFAADVATANGYYNYIADPYTQVASPAAADIANYFTREGSAGSYIYTKATKFAAGTDYYENSGIDYVATKAGTGDGKLTEEQFNAGTFYLENGSEATAFNSATVYYIHTPNAECLSNETQPNAGNFTQKAYYTYAEGIDESRVSSEATQEDLTTAKDQFKNTVLGTTGQGSTTRGSSSVLAVTYTIYLDGWDKFCFNGVQGQTITLDLEYQGAFSSN